MGAFALLFPAAVITVIAVIGITMPFFVSATVPLGVRIPTDRVAEPVVHRTVRRYQVLVAIGWLVAMVVGAALSTQPALAVIASIAVFIAIQLAAYITSRTTIQHAKRTQGWYADKPVRLAAELTPSHVAPPVGWMVAAAVVLLVTCAVGIAVYPGLPEHIVRRWNADGTPVAWVGKSVWTVFAPVIVGTVIVAVMFGLSFVVRHAPIRPDPAATAAQSAARAHALHVHATAFLGHIALLAALEFAWISIVGWLVPRSAVVVRIGVIVIALVIVATIVLFFVRYRAALRKAGPVSGRGGADAPDDDRFWKAGVFYVNRDDPSILVQKRYGIGWTLNFGHPLAVVIAVVLAAIIIGVFGWRAVEASHVALHW